MRRTRNEDVNNPADNEGADTQRRKIGSDGQFLSNDVKVSTGKETSSTVTTKAPAALVSGAGQDATPEEEDPGVPSTVLIQLKSMDGETSLGPAIDIESDIGPKQLEHLTKVLLRDNPVDDIAENSAFTFYLNDQELLQNLADAIKDQKLSAEDTLVVRYQPLSRYRVLPVTRCQSILRGHASPILHVSFSPSGNLLASGGGDQYVRFWNPDTGMSVADCHGHSGDVLCTSWSPDGLHFVSADKTGVLRIWDPTGKRVIKDKHAAKKAHSSWITSIAWEPHHLSTSEDGSCVLFATASNDKTVKVWNVKTGAQVFSIAGHSDSIECVKWGGQGHIYTASRDRTINVWKVNESKTGVTHVHALRGHAHRINFLALNLDATYRSGPFSNDTMEESKACFQGIDHAFPSYHAAREISKKRYEKALAAAGGKEVMVSCSDDATLYLWNPADSSKPILRMLGHQAPVTHLAYSPDGRYIASCSFDKKVKLWDGRTGKFLMTLTGHVASVYQAAWAADSRSLATASKDSTIKIWRVTPDILTGKAKPHALHTLSGHDDEVFALDWSPNGESVASGSRDRTVRM